VPRVYLHHALTAGADVAGCERLLSDEECGRRDRLLRAQDRLQFTVAHALLRTALSQHLPEVAPEAWKFRPGDRGKPELDGEIRFNLTHTDGLVACVIADAIDVGIDAEPIDRDIPSLERVLAPVEIASVLAAAHPGAAFFARWTLKEAYAKARGLGLALPFASLAFSLDAQRISLVGEDGWSFHQLRPTERHVLSVAAHAPAVDFVTR
jgi:4'-phosphopantetheinyl transferase